MKNLLSFKSLCFVLSASIAAGDEKALLQAVENGDVDGARRMAQTKEAVNATDDRGYTLLTIAALQGNLEMVRLLVEAGAEIGTPVEKGFTVVQQLESTLRRINMNTPEYKRKEAEQMRQEGLSEDVIRKHIRMIEWSAPPGPPKSAEEIRNLKAVLDYLKKAQTLKENSDVKRGYVGSSSSRLNGAPR